MSRTPKMSVSLGCVYLFLLLVETVGSTFPKEYHCDNDFTGYTYNDCHREWSDIGCYREDHSGGIGSCAPLCNTIHSLRGDSVCRQRCGRYFATCSQAFLTTINDAIVNSSDPNADTSQIPEHQWKIILVGSVIGGVGVIAAILTATLCYCKKKEKACFKSNKEPAADIEMDPLMEEGRAGIRPTEETGETGDQNPENHAREQGQSVEATSDSTRRLCTETNHPEGTMPNSQNTVPDNPANPAAQQPNANPPYAEQQPGANPSTPQRPESNPDQPGAATNLGPDQESSEPSVPLQHGTDDLDQDNPHSSFHSLSTIPPASASTSRDGLDDGYGTNRSTGSTQSVGSDALSGGFDVTDSEGTATSHNLEENGALGPKGFVETTFEVNGLGKDTALKLQKNVAKALDQQQRNSQLPRTV